MSATRIMVIRHTPYAANGGIWSMAGIFDGLAADHRVEVIEGADHSQTGMRPEFLELIKEFLAKHKKPIGKPIGKPAGVGGK